MTLGQRPPDDYRQNADEPMSPAQQSTVGFLESRAPDAQDVHEPSPSVYLSGAALTGLLLR
jgi:hypothetical protein